MLLALTVFNGCVRETYLKPLGEGSYLRHCGGGRESHLAFQVREGFAASLQVRPQQLILYFYLGPGHRLSINDPHLEVVTKSGTAHRVPIDTHAYYLPYDSSIESSYSSTAELKGSRVPESRTGKYFISEWQKYRWYRVWVDLSPPILEDYTVHWPPLTFDGEPLELQEISVQQVTEYVHYSLGC